MGFIPRVSSQELMTCYEVTLRLRSSVKESCYYSCTIDRRVAPFEYAYTYMYTCTLLNDADEFVIEYVEIILKRFGICLCKIVRRSHAHDPALVLSVAQYNSSFDELTVHTIDASGTPMLTAIIPPENSFIDYAEVSCLCLTPHHARARKDFNALANSFKTCTLVLVLCKLLLFHGTKVTPSCASS